MRALLDGSEIRESHRDGDTRVQDPYCIRCQPQVIGAAMDLLRQAGADAGDRGQCRHRQPAGAGRRRPDRLGRQFPRRAGGFRRRQIALALAEIGAIAQRRIALMVDPTLSHDLPPFLTPDPGLNSGLHDRRGDHRRADEREQAPGQPLRRPTSTPTSRQPGGSCQHGRPWRAAAGPDDRQPGAHPRGRAALRRARDRIPRAAGHQRAARPRRRRPARRASPTLRAGSLPGARSRARGGAGRGRARSRRRPGSRCRSWRRDAGRGHARRWPAGAGPAPYRHASCRTTSARG